MSILDITLGILELIHHCLRVILPWPSPLHLDFRLQIRREIRLQNPDIGNEMGDEEREELRLLDRDVKSGGKSREEYGSCEVAEGSTKK